MAQYPLRVRNAGRRRRGTRCAGKLVRPQDRANLSSRIPPRVFFSAKSGSAHRENTKSTKAKICSNVLSESTVFRPPSIAGVSLATVNAALVTPPDVRTTAVGEARVHCSVGVGACELGEGTSAFSLFVFDTRAPKTTFSDALIVHVVAPPLGYTESRVNDLSGSASHWVSAFGSKCWVQVVALEAALLDSDRPESSTPALPVLPVPLLFAYETFVHGFFFFCGTGGGRGGGVL